jgi:Right handed beta helix region/Domain of unknown function DUF11
MTRLPLLLVPLLFSLSALAQGTDLEVTIAGEERAARRNISFGVHVRWSGAEVPENVVLEVDVPGEIDIFEWSGTDCTPGRPIRCTIELRPDVESGFYAYARVPGPGTYVATARITSTTPDANPANNVATKTFAVAALPSLRPYGVPDLPEIDVVDPAGPAALRIGVQNDGEPATDVIARATLPDGGRFTELGSWESPFCTIVSETEVTCRFGDATRPLQFSLPFVAPDRPNGGTFRFRVTADTAEDDFNPSDDVDEGEILLRRLFAVTNGSDDGPGSLRQAILDSREACETIPCLLGVRAETHLWIQPRTPLPNLRGRVKVDGGPLRATLDGALLPAGDGLHFENGCEFRVDEMVVRNFKGHGIEGRQVRNGDRPCGFSELLTPMFVTRSELTGNERGVVSKGISATITDNVIAENRRAGVFADGGYYADVSRNVVVRNGATGIFINPGKLGLAYLPPGAEVINNIVHGNGEWGIARAPHGSVYIVRNSVAGNGLYGIDYGLDLETPNAPNKPEVLSATYDAARDATVVRVRFEPGPSGFGAYLEVFASRSLSVHGYPEAERPVADTFRTGEVELAVPGDLRGQWITATGTRTIEVIFARDPDIPVNAIWRYSAFDTSELSNAVQVN